MSHYTSLLLVVATICSSFSCFGNERREIGSFRTYGNPAYEQMSSEIKELFETFKHTWHDQDVEGHLRLFAKDVEWINAYSRLFQNRTEMGAFLEEQLFPAFDSKVSKEEILNSNLISTRYLGDDAAVIHMYTNGTRGPSRNDGEANRRTHIHLVIERQNLEWKIVHMAVMDARN